MSHKAKLKPGYFSGGGSSWIRRLNILLRFSHKDLALLDDEKWENLLDDLHKALYNAERDRKADDIFNRTATRESVREAQRGLDRALKSATIPIEFKLAEQVLRIDATEQTEKHLYYWFVSEHFPTSLYTMFAYLLEASDVKSSDFRLCANETCGYPFVPLRTPRQGKPSYCSPRCGTIVAMRTYRKRLSEAKKQKERERSHRKYKTRMEARQGKPTRVQRKPRKPK